MPQPGAESVDAMRWPGAGGPAAGIPADSLHEPRLQAALTAGRIAAWHADLLTHERWWSPEMFAVHGLAAGDAVPADYMTLVHPADRAQVEAALARSVATGAHEVQYRVVWPDGSLHWVEGVGRTTLDAQGQPHIVTGICSLIDARKREESDLRFLAQASAEIASSTDYEETLRRMAALAVPHFADWCAVDMLDEHGELRRLAVAHVDPAKVSLAQELHNRYPPDREATRGTWRVLRTASPEMVAEITDELLERGAADATHLGILRSLGLRSYLGVPIAGPDRVLGVITFVSSDSRRVYTQRDLDLATDLVSRAAVAIQNAQLFRALRDSQARQTFLLSLTDVLRGSGGNAEILGDVCAMLGRHFGVDRVGYGHVDETLDLIDYDVCWTDGTVPSLLGRFPASAFGPQVIARLRAGETIAIGNVRDHPLTSEQATVKTSQEVETRAILVVPLFKAGRLRTIVYLNQRPARAWTAAEISLMEDVAERTRELIERGRAEDALRASEARWRGLFERMAEGFFVGEAIRDAQGRMHDFRFLEVNPAFEKLTGVPLVSAIGRPVTEVIPGVQKELIASYARVVDTGEAAEFEVMVPALDDRWYEARASRVGPGQFSVLFLDITQRKRTEEALRQADVRKDEFLATLAHELRNPLAPLRNGLAILGRSDGSGAAAARARELMERQLAYLVRLVDDLLDVSRVSQGKVTMRKAVTSLQAVVELALETSRPLIEAAGHQLTVRLPAAPVMMDVDSTRMAQVFSNLLNNAAKYTPAGGTITLEAQLQGPAMLQVVVADNGVGIPADMLERVFDLFAQVGSALDRSQGGLGIGLSLARRLVELHGGRIRAESAGPNRGSRFVIDLPVLAAEADEPGAQAQDGASAEPGAGSRRSILVVDDNKDAAETLAMLLELEGHAVHLAHSGQQALEVAVRERPDIIFLDIGLPDIDGYAVAASLRGHPASREAFLVALTGWGAARDRERSRAAGFDLHLTKPVAAGDIAAALAR